MKYYKYIFAVVLYKNMNDVTEMIESVSEKVTSYKIIIVNNYFDDLTSGAAKEIAKQSNCAFIETENNGYGSGNNRALAYAAKNYEFDYFIVSNPDVVIRKFDESLMQHPESPTIYAPDIICKSGKHQNPMWIYKSDLLEWLQYNGEKYKSIPLNYGAIIIRKVERELFLILKSKSKHSKIYAAHGAFCIISKGALKAMGTLYSENMFLFFEEAWLANKAYKNSVKVYYAPEIIIDHKEDGSMKLSTINISEESRKSVMYYYEHKKA